MASPPPSYVEVAAALKMPIGSIGPVRGRCLEQLRRPEPPVGRDTVTLRGLASFPVSFPARS